jgi:putative peptidoglycan lipid II flippase
MWSANSFNWTALRAQSLWRVGLLAMVIVSAGVLYFSALWAAGVKLRQFARRQP